MNSTPAFPQPYTGALHDAERTTRQGMTLRDYFAAAALPAIIAMPLAAMEDLYGEVSVSEAAYIQADRMMRVRNQT